MVSMFVLVLIYAAFICLGLPDSLLGAVWPSINSALGLPAHLAGYISMITALGTVLSSIFSQYVIRRFGAGMVTALSIGLTAVSLMLISLMPHYIWLCIFALPLGMGAGAVDAALNNYAALHYKARHMNWLHCFWGIGASVGPLIAASVLSHKMAWNEAYRAISFILLGMTAVLFSTLNMWKKAQKHTNLTQSDQLNSIPLPKILKIAGVKQIIAAFFCYFTIETTAGLWGSSFLVIVKGISALTAARWLSLYYLGITFGRFLSGLLSIKVGNRQMIRIGMALIACGITALALPLGQWALLPAFFTIGLGCAPIYPSLLHSTPANFGAESSQAVMGVQMAAAYIGNTLMPLIFGWLASLFGFGIFPLFLAMALLIIILAVEKMNHLVRYKKNITFAA